MLSCLKTKQLEKVQGSKAIESSSICESFIIPRQMPFKKLKGTRFMLGLVIQTGRFILMIRFDFRS